MLLLSVWVCNLRNKTSRKIVRIVWLPQFGAGIWLANRHTHNTHHTHHTYRDEMCVCCDRNGRVWSRPKRWIASACIAWCMVHGATLRRTYLYALWIQWKDRDAFFPLSLSAALNRCNYCGSDGSFAQSITDEMIAGSTRCFRGAAYKKKRST